MALKDKAAELKLRADELRKAGTMKQMAEGPALLDEALAFIVDLAAQVDANTPYVDEAAT